jgi:centromeric protein E
LVWFSEREIQRGDEIAWYADGERLVRCEYNPATAYAYGKYFGNFDYYVIKYTVGLNPYW